MINELEKGFYYHYKHDPNGEVNNYAYEVLSIGHHTEMHHGEDGGVDESLMVVYRPLYESAFVYQVGKHWDVRPLSMFLEDITKDNKTTPRFQKIVDLETINKLIEIRDFMYK
ncbi:MAG: DUF1653 domain-containing protein [Candidatus Nomurabacteria bacterium]|nr:DUF1653 domain-containing protein [Candidatus Nomurabacteria bacterium]